jgi:hypothetical protein
MAFSNRDRHPPCRGWKSGSDADGIRVCRTVAVVEGVPERKRGLKSGRQAHDDDEKFSNSSPLSNRNTATPLDANRVEAVAVDVAV